MSIDGGASRERGPRRARYLIPKGTPRRAQIVAGLGTALVLAHLLAAQLTGVVAIVLYLVTWLTRWRRSWLWAPAAVGVLLVLATGPGRALDGYTAGPRQVLAFIGGVGSGAEQGRLWHLGDAFAGIGGWLPGQLPLALVAGSAEAAVACWMKWLHTDEWRLPEPRSGLVVAVRRIFTTRRIHGGAVVTKDGAALGTARATGRRTSLSWAEADHGVLITGVRGAGKTTTAFQLAHAAIRRRKPVIAVDLTGSPELIARARDACAATGTPFHLFTADGPGWYEPLRTGDAGRRALLVAGMVNWTGTGEQYRRTCTTYLTDLLSVVEAAPADARTSVLDEITHLLDPEALRARAAYVPDYHPQRQALLDRVQVSASAVTADPQATAQLHTQLTELHASPLGRRLRPDPFGTGAGAGEHDIDLSSVVHERGVVLFSLEPGLTGHAAGAVAGLIVQDVLALGQELRRIGVAGDGLVWVDEAEPVGTDALVDLAAHGRDAGLATVLTTSGVPQDRLVDAVGTQIVHRTADRGLAARFAAMCGERLVPGEPDQPPGGQGAAVVPPPYGQGGYGQAPQPGFARRPVIAVDEFADRAPGEFTLIVAAPRRRLVPLARTVRSRIAAPSGGRARRQAAAEEPPAAAPVVPPPPGTPDPPAYDTPRVVSGPAQPSIPPPAPSSVRDPRDAPPMPPSAERRSGPVPPSGPLPGHHRRS
ncbi:MAG TPA: hypothetical protein VGL93_25440 [Streptosporangiaceae bacterium]|jgi:hypothetical protein